MPHLSWPKLLPVSLRLNVARNLLMSGTALDTFGTDDGVRAVLEQFFETLSSELLDYGKSVRSPSQVAAEGPALDAYLSRVAASMSRMEAAVSDSSVASQALRAILSCCAKQVCHQCSGQDVCQWTTSSGAGDVSRMKTRGHCIQTVREFYEWSKDIALNEYKDRSSTVPPKLSTGHSGPNVELGLGIYAATNDALGPRGPRYVHLSVDPGSVWMADYLSLAYLFMHECIAHAFCGVSVVSPNARDTCAFHEGWMDCVAAEILLRHLTANSTFAPVASLFELIAEQTDDVRAIRFNASWPRRSKVVWEWKRGARAYQTLLWLFVEAMGLPYVDQRHAPAQALKALSRLSLDINASDLSHELRERFVFAIAKKYVRSEPSVRLVAIAERPQVIDSISRYLVDYDFRNFVDRITSA